MGKCSRNRGKGRQDHNLKNGHGPQAASGTSPWPQGNPANDPLKNFRLTDLITPPAPPAEPAGQTAGAGETGYSASRWNSLNHGRRSRILLPPCMQTVVDERSRDFAAERRARGKYELFLCAELARASVQIDSCTELLTLNKERILEKDESTWRDERTEAADRLARRFPDEPYETARALARTKYGTLLLISRWKSLGEAVASNQAFNEEQVHMAYNLLAVPKVLRDGSRQVPAANDGPALAALVERELAQHQAKLEQALNRRDELDRDAARLGIVKEYDKQTRTLRSDEARAHRRLRWAEATFQSLRQGVDPATVIDPETGRTINPDVHAATAAAAAPASPEPPQPPVTPTPTESSPESPVRPLPEGCSEVDAEMLRMVAEALGDLFRSPGTALPPTDEPGPPLA